jgi:hypothetical protein
MGCPGGSQQREGLFGEGDVALFGPLSPVDLDLEARAIDGRDLEGEGFMEPESHAGDGGEGALVVQGGSPREEAPHFFTTEDGGEAVCGLSPHQRPRVPITREDVVREAADATGAEAHGRWGEAIDVCAVQEGVLKLRFGEQVG